MTNVLATNIKALRASLGDNQTAFAARVGVDQSYVSKWERGTTPNGDALAKMASLAQCSFEQFKTEPWAPAVARSDHQPIKLAEQSAVRLKVVDLNLAMGDGGELEDWADEEEIEFDHNLLRAITRSPAERIIVTRPKGDSMFPTLINGDWVLIDTAQRMLNLDDKIWACSIYGAGAVKRLKAIGRGRIEVRSDNPIAGNREVDAEDVRILGRVIWIGREA
jgi:phage repressor protein C with HTH and peptisase S24 domain